jgi:hypothetical protein
MNEYIFDNGFKDIIKNNVGSYGLVKNDVNDINFDFFKISNGGVLGLNQTIIINEGVADILI